MKCPEPETCAMVETWTYLDRTTDKMLWTWSCDLMECQKYHETRADALQDAMEAHT